MHMYQSWTKIKKMVAFAQVHICRWRDQRRRHFPLTRSMTTRKFTIKEKKHEHLSQSRTNFSILFLLHLTATLRPSCSLWAAQIVPQLWHRSFNVRKSRERSPRAWQRSFYYAFVTTFCPLLVAHSPRDCFSFPRFLVFFLFFFSSYRTIFFVNARSFTGVNFSLERGLKV